MTERIVETDPVRDSNPALAVVAALLVALLIGVGLYLFANRDDNKGGGNNNPSPQVTNQQTTEPSSQPSQEPSSAPSSTP